MFERRKYWGGWAQASGAAALSIALALSAVYGASAAAQQDAVRFEIPAQAMESALEALATQAGVQVMSQSSVVAGVMAPALSGTYAPDEALAILLAGSGLEVRPAGDGAFVVRRAAGEDAEVRPLTPATEDEARAEETRAGPIDVIVVPGTLIHNLSQEYVASKIDTYTAEDIANSGYMTVSGFIQEIPQNSRGEFGETFAGGGIADGGNDRTSFAAPSLRGLGADATLTLLNGRRLPNAGIIEAPTVSFLPAALIKRVEVVADGASATYGADAVGGVINFVTRHDYEGVEVNARAGRATEFDNTEYNVNAAAGRSWSSGNVYGAVGWQDQELLLGPRINGLFGPDVQSTLIPDQQLLNLFGGVRQDMGNLTLTLDASYFERESYREGQPTGSSGPLATSTSSSDGYSLYGSGDLRLSERSSLEVLFDYHENEVADFGSLGGTTLASHSTTNTLLLSEVRLQSELLTLPAGPVQAVIGAQYRHEELTTDTVEFRSGGGEEEVRSIFAEAFVPLISEDQFVPYVRSLTASLAGRYEDFGDPAGSAFAPKIGLRWHVTDSLSLRSTYSESFLSPKLRDTVGVGVYAGLFQAVTDLFQEEPQDPRVADGQSIVLMVSGSNPKLVPQDAETFTVGFDFAATGYSGFQFGLGYYSTEFSNRIDRISQTQAFELPGYQIGLIRNLEPGDVAAYIAASPYPFGGFTEFRLPGVTGNPVFALYSTPEALPPVLLDAVQVIFESIPRNFAFESTNGFDFYANFSRPFLGGDATLGVNGQYILMLERQASAEAAVVSRVDTIYNPADLAMNVDLGWRRGAFSAGSSISYTDDYRDNRTGQNGVTIDSYTTASLHLSWNNELAAQGLAWLGDATVSVTVANLFDSQPPRIEALDGNNIGYDALNAATNPRRVSVSLTRRW